MTWYAVDVDGLRPQMMQQIQQVRIDRVHVPGSEVAQKMIHGAERVGKVVAATEIFDGQALPGVRVDEGESAGNHRGRRGEHFARRGDHRNRRGEA